MKWKLKGPVPRTQRVIKRFAFLPKKIGGFFVWFEYYYVQQIYDYIWDQSAARWFDRAISLDEQYLRHVADRND